MSTIFSSRIKTIYVNGLSLLGTLLFSNTAIPQKLNFVNYSVEQGLSQTQAQHIIQDQFGFIWIATLGGISRFDGNVFTNFYRKDGLESQIVYHLFHQNEVGLWIGNENGLELYNGRKFVPIPMVGDTADKPVTDIESLHNEGIYALKAEGNCSLGKIVP